MERGIKDMRRLLITAAAALTLLAGCGGADLGAEGGGSSVTPPTNTNPGPTVTGVSVITSSPQVPSDGTGPATITAVAHDANNNTVASAPLIFAATSGLLSPGATTTDANGTITATLSAGADPSNRTITITATSGTASGTVTIDVTGTSLSLTGPQSLVQPGSGTYTVTLKDSSHAGIVGEAVSLASASGNTLSAASVTTDANGQATFTVTAAKGGADTLTATALGLTSTQAISVSTQSFAISAPAANADVNLGVVQPVTVIWKNNGTPVTGQTVNFSATRGTLSAATAVTDSTGTASVTISSAASGPSVITASGTGVSTEADIDFIATTASAIDVQASPSTININAQSTITAIVRDAADNLVEGKTVAFALTDTTGGTLSLGSAVTNDQGLAQTIYTATSTTSATNGVVITATVQGTSVHNTADLTVAGETVFLSLGTGNTIDILNEAQYAVTYAVQAIDSAGNAVPNITIDLKVTSLSYYKGEWTPPTPPATAPPWVQDITAPLCPTEDLLGNGIYEASEDYNHNGKLDPGNVAAASPGSVVTSATASGTLPAGSATFQVVYPKDHAFWVTVELTATATVAGTQASTSTQFELNGAAADYSNADVGPPGEISPYGQANTCSNPN
jgi:hypothetical protein